jgi:hypothetical protein
MKKALTTLIVVTAITASVAVFLVYRNQQKKGVLFGKTKEEKDEFFLELFNLLETNEQQLNETLKLFLIDELKEFEEWMLSKVSNLETIRMLLRVIEKLQYAVTSPAGSKIIIPSHTHNIQANHINPQ